MPLNLHCLIFGSFLRTVAVGWIPSSPSHTGRHNHDVLRLASASTSATASASSREVSAKPLSKASAWFPTRIQDSFPYEQLVRRLFVRQVVTLTQDMAVLALAEYQALLTGRSGATSAVVRDPFAHVAAMMSADRDQAEEGGKVGWVDAYPPVYSSEMNADSVTQQRLPGTVIQSLFQQRPKPGDIITIHGPDYWHVIQVLEIWMPDPILATTTASSATTSPPVPVGSYAGTNSMTPIKKLKGKGVLPEFPELLTYSIHTAGCQMNVADSERLAGILQQELQLTPFDTSEGPTVSDIYVVATTGDSHKDKRHADLIILNTCSIRDHAEQKVYDFLGPWAALKRQGSSRLALVVTGCVAQQHGLKLLQRVPELDAVVGPQYIPHLKRILEQVARGQQVVVTEPLLMLDHRAANDGLANEMASDGGVLQQDEATSENTAAIPTHQPIRGHAVRAWVNVMYGCNEHCSYCVVPSTRGMEQSRTMEAILDECLALSHQHHDGISVGNGYKEVTLIGQNVDAYGRDMVPKRTFADLLEFLNARLPAKMRIRYVTSHPRYFSDRVIDAVANLDKVCECFHMPFQAGDDQVLKRMRRGYTFDSYMKIISRIKEKCPNAGITADIIVGFPGESDDAFLKTLELMEAVKFDNVNSFTYSPRPNTEAALFEDQIPEDVKSERLQRVQQLAAKHGLERSQRYLGRTVEVLVEDANPRSDKQVWGRTREGRQVYFDGDLAELVGQYVMVKITEARAWSLMGEPVV